MSALHQMPRGQRMAVRLRLYRKQEGCCALCGEIMLIEVAGVQSLMPRFATIDHITERRNGGSDKNTNLRLTCKKCNEGRDQT